MFDIPILLERKNAQQQIDITVHLTGASGARSPHLRRHDLNDLRVPILKGAALALNDFAHAMRQPKVKPRKIDADDCMRRAIRGQFEETPQPALEESEFLQYI